MDEPRWLDADEQHAWRRLAAVLMRLPAELERQLQRDSGISEFEYWILAMLSEAEDRTLQLKHLAQRANASPSRLSHVVRRLEERGWVERRQSETDARVSNAVLTEAGWEKVVASAPGHADAVRRYVFDAVSERDVADLSRICDVILEQLEARPQG